MPGTSREEISPQTNSPVSEDKGRPIYGFCKRCKTLRKTIAVDGISSVKTTPSTSRCCCECADDTVVLQHLKQSTASTECVICRDRPTEMCVQMSCQHTTCLDCFVDYCRQMLNQMRFRIIGEIGYTVACPMYKCAEHVTDPHLFYLMGLESYRSYKLLAAQMFLAKQPQRHYCPFASCGAGFTLEETKEGEKAAVLCPECNKLHCRLCRNSTEGCKCARQGASNAPKDPNRMIIQSTTRKCPGCSAPTERSGGCSHIECLQCKTEWCFVCGEMWSSKCQWDHWFA